MRKLLTTTAIAAIAASPLAAQSDQGPATMNEAVSGNDVTVAEVLDSTVYVHTGNEGDISWTAWSEIPLSWEASGEIEDLLLGEDGKVQAAVLSRGGILDIGDTEVQVDIEKFGVLMDSDDEGEFFVVYTGKPSELKSAQPFEGPAEGQTSAGRQGDEAAQAGAGNSATTVQEDIPKTAAEAVSTSAKYGETGKADESASAEGVPIAAEPTTENAASGDVEGASNIGMSSDQKVMGVDAGASQAPEIEGTASGDASLAGMTADELRDMPVYTSDDAWVGEISALRLGEGGDVTHAVIDMGGFLGLGETPVDMPVEKLSVEQDGDGELRAQVDMTEEAMKQLEEEANQL